jgi:hypothetical protein
VVRFIARGGMGEVYEAKDQLEGVNDPNGFDSFMNLAPEGQPAIMSRTGEVV